MKAEKLCAILVIFELLIDPKIHTRHSKIINQGGTKESHMYLMIF